MDLSFTTQKSKRDQVQVVFTIKADGRYKAQVVAKGFTQEHGIDYEETFSPVTRYKSIRYLLAHAALEDWEIEAMDVKTAYLYGKLKEEIYMAQPEGFIKSGQEHKVCKLVKSIYGLKQAGRVWYETISKTLQKKLGFQQLHSDAGVHVLRQREGDHEIILILYVDDLLIMGNSQPMIYSIKKQLMEAYQMKDLGAAISYLGIRITRDRKKQSIWIEQEDYIHNALTRFNLLNANNTKTPLPEGVHLVATTELTPPEKLTQYQQLIGTLLYASIGTCPDIAFAVTRLSRYNTNPTDEHHRYAQYILKYLKGTIKTRILYDGSSHAGLIGYSDSDWGENKDDRHSTSGQVFTLANGAISWHSRQQKTVTLSVAEAEYMELAETTKQAAWLSSFSQEIGRSSTHPTTICADNQAAIFLATNPAQQTRIKHMDIRYHYVQEQVEDQ